MFAKIRDSKKSWRIFQTDRGLIVRIVEDRPCYFIHMIQARDRSMM